MLLNHNNAPRVVLPQRMTTYFISQNIIDSEDEELYLYGIRQLFVMTLNFATAAAVGLLFGMLWQCMGFMTFFIPLRRYAGGYHARTQLRCYLTSVCLLVAVLLTMGFLVPTPVTALVLSGVFGLVIWILAPIGDENKPLDELENQVFRRKTRMILLAEAGALLVFAFAGFHSALLCVTGAWAASGSLILLKKAKESFLYLKL